MNAGIDDDSEEDEVAFMEVSEYVRMGILLIYEELQPLQIIIGQERAIRALEFGLAIQDPGFNIYVAGLPGTGTVP